MSPLPGYTNPGVGPAVFTEFGSIGTSTFKWPQCLHSRQFQHQRRYRRQPAYRCQSRPPLRYQQPPLLWFRHRSRFLLPIRHRAIGWSISTPDILPPSQAAIPGLSCRACYLGVTRLQTPMSSEATWKLAVFQEVELFMAILELGILARFLGGGHVPYMAMNKF